MTGKRSLPPAFQLVVVTDGQGDLPRIESRASAVLASGPAVVMLREASWDLGATARACEVLHPMIRAAGGQLLVNLPGEVGLPRMVGRLIDRGPELTRLGCLDGLHFSQRELARWGGLERARQALGPSVWLGVSAHDARELRAAECTADYATISPVFATACKPTVQPLDLAAVEKWCAESALPVLWLGGVDATTAKRAWRAGAAGVAAMSALMAPTADSSAAGSSAAGSSALAMRRPPLRT